MAGLILENPLPSIPYMVRALYPQRWLPYHYLGPFAFDRWDAISAIDQLAQRCDGQVAAAEPLPPTLWIRSGRDEIIPHGAGDGVKRMYAGWASASGEAALVTHNGTDPHHDQAPPRSVGEARLRQVEERRHGLAEARWVNIPHALHDTAYMEKRWRDEIRRFVDMVLSNASR